MKRRLFLFLAALSGCAAQAADLGEDALWQRLRSGNVVVLMRHAATNPGIGDPPGFVLDQCSTQRNLSPVGQADARAIGARFQARQVRAQAVWSSRWCRCLDTARLAFGQVTPEPSLDSLFTESSETAAARLRALYARLAARRDSGTLLLVTHDVNIQALTGRSLAQGEMVVTELRNGSLTVLGELPRPPRTVLE